jgi:hypothetical protein
MKERAGEGQSAPVPLTAKELEMLWTDLASTAAAKAYRAIWSLRTHREQGLRLLQERLRPLPSVDPKHFHDLLTSLNSDRFAVREQAETELRKVGPAVEYALRRALADKPTLELRRRLERLLQQLETPDYRRALRTTEVLEYLNTVGAEQFLRQLSQGSAEAQLTQEARASLQRMAKLRRAIP